VIMAAEDGTIRFGEPLLGVATDAQLVLPRNCGTTSCR